MPLSLSNSQLCHIGLIILKLIRCGHPGMSPRKVAWQQVMKPGFKSGIVGLQTPALCILPHRLQSILVK